MAAGRWQRGVEAEARERLFHQAREVLRVRGVDVALRAWASPWRLLEAVWEAVAPNLETRAFEEAADAVREEAWAAARGWGAPGAWKEARLGESQRFQARGALALYHTLLPRLLVLAEAVEAALEGVPVGRREVALSAPRVERGAPAALAALEWAPEDEGDARVRAVWEEVGRVLGPPGVPGEWRALGLWPSYLEAAWRRVRPRLGAGDFGRAAQGLRRVGREGALGLPYEVALSRERLEVLGVEGEEAVRVTGQLARRLPAEVLCVAWLAAEAGVEARPFLAPARVEADWVAAEALT